MFWPRLPRTFRAIATLMSITARSGSMRLDEFSFSSEGIRAGRAAVGNGCAGIRGALRYRYIRIMARGFQEGSRRQGHLASHACRRTERRRARQGRARARSLAKGLYANLRGIFRPHGPAALGPRIQHAQAIRLGARPHRTDLWRARRGA